MSASLSLKNKRNSTKRSSESLWQFHENIFKKCLEMLLVKEGEEKEFNFVLVLLKEVAMLFCVCDLEMG